MSTSRQQTVWKLPVTDSRSLASKVGCATASGWVDEVTASCCHFRLVSPTMASEMSLAVRTAPCSRFLTHFSLCSSFPLPLVNDSQKHPSWLLGVQASSAFGLKTCTQQGLWRREGPIGEQDIRLSKMDVEAAAQRRQAISVRPYKTQEG